MKSRKPSILLTSPVFQEIMKNTLVSPDLRENIQKKLSRLRSISNLYVAPDRFPGETELIKLIKHNSIDFIGCHLSHPITSRIIENPLIKAVCTSTAGFNHISHSENILITHTPSVLDKAVADFTIALILNNLRNMTSLHHQVWSGNWEKSHKWDLDDNLSNSIDSKTLGIVGLGEIGKEIVRRLAPWGIRIMYTSRSRQTSFESLYPDLVYVENPDLLFRKADIISLHVPLTKETKHYVNKDLLKIMKKGALLVNTSRGEVIQFHDLITLFKSNQIHINLAFDVYDPEPLTEHMLKEFRLISEKNPDLNFTFIPHNASSDADTRARMAIMMMNNLILLSESRSWSDLKDMHLIPGQKNLDREHIKNFRICNWWKEKTI